MRSSFLLLLSALSLIANAQRERVGCHFPRNGEPRHIALTDGEIHGINQSIARSDTFDIKHYDIAIDVTDYAGQELKASTTVSFTPRMSDQTFIRFDLKDLTVDSVSMSGQPLTFDHTDDILRVDLPFVPNIGDPLEVVVHYHGHPYQDPNWGGFYFEANYIYNLGIGLTTIPPNFGKVWYPCFDSFVERASYTYHVKSAGTYRAHCQGDFLGEVQLLGDTVIRSFDMPHEIPTHVSAIAVSDYVDFDTTHTGAYGTTPVRLTAKPVNLAAMKSRFTGLGNAIDALEFWYGPQPFSRVGYVLTTDGALEIPTNIAYPQFMTGQPLQDNQDLYSHELGHHWWGDIVTPYTHNEMWLKEGPAEYSGHLVEEFADGEQAFVDIVKDNQLFVLEQAHIQDDGFHALSPMPDAHIYGRHTYYKGASVLHNLRGYLGDTLFRQGMTGVQQNYADTALTAAEFRDLLEQITGADLDAFFDAWIFAPGFSVFVVDQMSTTPSGGQFEVDLTLRQRLRAAPAFHQSVPLDVTLIGANWERQEYQVLADDELTDIELMCDFEPVMAVLNGHNRLNQARMDYDRVIQVGETVNSVLPRTEFRLFTDVIADSTLFRVEHVWAGPEADQLGWGVDEISGTHYWIVDGIWPEGDSLRGRMYYDGTDSTDLDFDLVHDTEQDIMFAYRPDGTQPWEPYFDATVSAGNLFNANGYITIDHLRKGQYAFAKGTAIAGVNEAITADASAIIVSPVPANDAITIRGTMDGPAKCTIEVIGLDGRRVISEQYALQGAFAQQLDVRSLATGHYVVQLRDASMRKLGQAKFEVVR